MALPRSWGFFLGACALPVAAACGSARSNSGATASTDAGHDVAAADATPDADTTDATAPDADADGAISFCTDPPDGGVLSSVETVASGRSDLTELGISDAGPVWLEAREYDFAQVVLGTTPPRVLYDTRDGQGWINGSLLVAPKLFALLFTWFSYDPLPDTLAVGSVPTGSSMVCFPPNGVHDLAVDGSQFFALSTNQPWAVDPGSIDHWVYAYEATEACSSASGSILDDLGSDLPIGIAVDRSEVYVYIEGSTGIDDQPSYEIRSLPKTGGPMAVVAAGVDPEQSAFRHATLVARHGSVAWARVGTAATHFITVYRQDWSQSRTLVSETAGIGYTSAGDGRVAIALDDEYLYWTTLDGFVKRIRLCGGTPEVLASNQDQPIAIAVDDNAVYWLNHGTDPGTGTVMRRRKLGAPGYPDASSDSGTDSNIDANTSSDAGSEDASGGDANDAGD